MPSSQSLFSRLRVKFKRRRMSRYQLFPPKVNISICRSLVYISALWFVLLMCFLHLSDLERVEKHQRRRLSLDYNDMEEIVNDNRNGEQIVAQVSQFPKEKKNIEQVKQKITKQPVYDIFTFKKIVTPVPEHIRKQLGLVNPGEKGAAVPLSGVSPEIQKRIDRGWKSHQFNEFVSDLLPLNRSLPDPRDAYCKQPGLYGKNLPATSVIFIFHNEAWSTLLRSVHSVLNQSPEHLITEVILVDDASTMPHLKQALEVYMSRYPKVKIIRAPSRGGLIKARLLGAKAAKGPILTFLDSHIECADGWLEPLLDPIAKDPTISTCPVIDVIDDTDFKFNHQSSEGLQVGGFEWSLLFTWIPVPARERKRKKNSAEPTRSPTMAGGLFSIDKKFFEKLGMYDKDFDIWGGENLEMSFKLWMCGGTLLIIPCSHVGHIFRKKSPYTWRPGVDVLRKNLVRLAEVWMDDHAKFYYLRTGDNKGNFGDVSEQKKLREDLKCKSFKWYMETIIPEMIVPDNLGEGYVKNRGMANNYCLDAPTSREIHQSPVQTYPCHYFGGTQFIELTKKNEVARDIHCLEYIANVTNSLQFNHCRRLRGNQEWIYNITSEQLVHKQSNLCLSVSGTTPIMEYCHPHNTYQKWFFQYLYKEKFAAVA